MRDLLAQIQKNLSNEDIRKLLELCSIICEGADVGQEDSVTAMFVDGFLGNIVKIMATDYALDEGNSSDDFFAIGEEKFTDAIFITSGITGICTNLLFVLSVLYVGNNLLDGTPEKTKSDSHEGGV
jgi:hypothetical protein